MGDDTVTVFEKIKKGYKNIPSSYKTAIVIGAIVAFATYITVLGNRIPNHDDINHLYSTRFNPGHGRWFQGVPATWSGVLSTPLSATLGILYTLIASVFVNSVLKIKTTFGAVLTTCLMVTFPNLFCLMFYLNDVDTDMFAWLLVCVGVWLSVNKKQKILPVVLYTLSLGIYQSYIAFAVGIICIVVLQDFLEDEKPVKDILFDILRHGIQMLVSLILYFVITKIVLKVVDTSLISGQGIDMAGQNYTIRRMLGMLKDSYIEPVKYYIQEDFPRWLAVLFIISLLFTLFLIINKIRSAECDALRLILTVCVLLAFPAACGCIYFFGAEDVHNLMIAGYICIPLLMIVTVEGLFAEKNRLLRIGGSVAMACVSIYICQHIITANEGYVFQSIVYEQSICYYNRLMTRIEETDGFTGDETIYIMGIAEPLDFADSTLVDIIKDEKKLSFCHGMDWFLAGRNIPTFVKNEMGINYKIYQIPGDDDEEEPDEDEGDVPYHDILNRYGDMATYPQKNSIAIEDGAILVKLR